MGCGITKTDICPHAWGFIPQELTCRLNVCRDAKLPWWKRLWRSLRGDYCCMTEGTLPCPVMAAYNEARQKEGK